MALPDSYYEELRGRVQALLIEVADQLPAFTVDLVTELIDANEPGVAVETISEMLAEAHGEISAGTLGHVHDLVTTMHLDPLTTDRLRPLVAR
jgi:hypothetical protein